VQQTLLVPCPDLQPFVSARRPDFQSLDPTTLSEDFLLP
jgi:hypothetical protein